MALHVEGLLQQAGFTVNTATERGLDHGAWVPLRLMYPDADVPVMQVSLVRGATPAENLKLGRALSSLRDKGVLIIGSGSLTHNLYEMTNRGSDTLAPSWVRDFQDWMKDRVDQNDSESLLHYRIAPFAARNHPSEEHLSPNQHFLQ